MHDSRGKDAWFLVESPVQHPPSSREAVGSGSQLQETLSRRDATMRESEASLSRSVATLHETRAVGADTLEELDRQGQQIDRIHRRAEDVQHSMKESSRLLRSIESVWGTLRNKFSRSPARSPSTVAPRVGVGERLEAEWAAEVPPSTQQAHASPSPSRDFMDGETAAYMDRTDAALDDLSSALGDLKQMGLVMNAELNDQQVRLQHLDALTTDVKHDLDKQTRRTWKLL